MLIMSLYETFEYAFCYNDEKKEQLQRFSLVRQAQALSRRLFDRGGRVDRSIIVKEKNNFGFQHSIEVYFVPFICIRTYAKNQSDQIMFSDLSTISKF